MAKSSLNTKDSQFAREELKPKALNEIQTKATSFGIKREYHIEIKNRSPQELDKALQTIFAKVCNFFTINN